MTMPQEGRAFAMSGGGYNQFGMTLREYYAGQVLPSVARNWHIDKVDEENAEILARIAFSIADAMIKEGAALHV